MISPTAEYALRAVVAIAQANGEAAATQSIAKLTKVPAGYLPKVLQMLGRAGLVDSKRGLGGGFRLAKPAEVLTVLEVVNAVEPIKRINKCPLDLKTHGGNLCPLHKRLDEATEHVERSFAQTTIAQLLAQPGRSTPFCDEPDNRTCGVKLGTKLSTVPEGPPTSRRHKALIEWSRDHTLGLAVAKHLTESSSKGGDDRRSALQEFLAAWRDNLADHFTQEEECLLPVLRGKGDAKRLQKEHAAIRANVELAGAFVDDDDIDATWLLGVGKLLHDHIRWEERELFPSIEQTASKEELQRIAQHVADARTGTRGKSRKRSPTKRKPKPR
jgi:Rrf2 family protein